MNRRECLKALAALGASLSLPALAIESASENDINAAWQDLQSSSHHGLADHPRVVLLRNDVLNLPVDNEYKAHLLNSIDLYYDHIINRPVYTHDEAWDDLEAIQQVTLGDLNEKWFREQQAITAYNEKKSSPIKTLTLKSSSHQEKFDIDREYIDLWLSYRRESPSRNHVDIRTHASWPKYPQASISGMAAGAVAWQTKLEFDNDITKDELTAEVVIKVMDSEYIIRGGWVAWSETEYIRIIKTSHPNFSIRNYPHIETYNCILYYPEATTKEDLITNAVKITDGWCPTALVVLSDSEVVNPLEFKLQQALLLRNK
jgi:hypothetical protein